jgi:altronate dehydratase small subunit
MRRKTKAIVIDTKDNVAIALMPLGAHTTVPVEIEGHIEEVKLVSDIPAGHKFALRDLEEGGIVVKYGEPIGQSTARISRGEHVHIHNIASQPQGDAR